MRVEIQGSPNLGQRLLQKLDFLKKSTADDYFLARSRPEEGLIGNKDIDHGES